MNATQILENKGIEANKINEYILSEIDCMVRETFNVAAHPVHLWDSYAIGDADEAQMLIDANCDGYWENIDDLLEDMTVELERLASEYTI